MNFLKLCLLLLVKTGLLEVLFELSQAFLEYYLDIIRFVSGLSKDFQELTVQLFD